MGTQEKLPPEAQLMESMRSVGYSLDTAIADIIDNSVAAGARTIRITFESGPEAHVAILDDGVGMSRDELRTAMRFAGKPPSLNRERRDLGRFGLGLKTASLSQAKRLIVVSKQDTLVHAAVWDVDIVDKTQAWTLEWLDRNEWKRLPEIDNLLSQKRGTLVIWQHLDVLLAAQQDEYKALINSMARASEHLSLVFHRFLDGNPRDRISIWVNDRKLDAIDPFFTKNSGTQHKPETQVLIDGSPVVIKPYILPHLTQLNRVERKESEFLKSRFRDTQGFYIYREKRLISYGSWFRIVGRSELAKLARVQVDTTNSLDLAWKLGVTKSKIEPPAELRRALEHLVPNIIGDSRKVLQRTGTVVTNAETQRIWHFRELGNHEFRLQIDDQHPLVAALDKTFDEEQRRLFTRILEQIELGVPVNELSTRLLGDQSAAPFRGSSAESLKYAKSLYEVLRPQFPDGDLAVEAILRMEPFASQPMARESLRNHLPEILSGPSITRQHRGENTNP